MSSEQRVRIWQEVKEIIGENYDLITWLEKNYRKFDTIDGLLDSPELENLSRKQVKRMKECLKVMFVSNCDENLFKKNISEYSISQKILSPYELQSANVFPLITCFEARENNYVVEKFLVREEYIRKLCISAGGKDVYYTDISGGININFEKLQNVVGVPIGVCGKIARAKSFFREVLSQDSFEALWTITDKEGSGMYLVLPNDVIHEPSLNAKGKIFYLYFYSKNDYDYDNVNSESRAVHFIRYITQLSGNLVLLLETDDEALLLCKADLEKQAKERVSEFRIDQIQTREEGVFLGSQQIVPLPGKQSDKMILQGSTNCLLAIQSMEKKSEKCERRKHVDSNLTNFESEFQLSDICDVNNICPAFINEYLQTFHLPDFQRIDKACSQKEALLRNGEEAFMRRMDLATVIHSYKMVSPTSFRIIETFFTLSSDTAGNKKLLWETYIENKSIIEAKLNAINTEELQVTKIRTALNRSSETLQRICLSSLLEYDLVDYSTPFTELLSKAWQNGCLGSTKSMKVFNRTEPEPNSEVVQKFYSKTVESLCQISQSYAGRSQPQLEKSLRSEVIAIIDELIRCYDSEDTKLALFQNEEYEQTKRKLFQESIKREISREKETSQRFYFKDLVQTAKRQSKQIDSSKVSKSKPVISIQDGEKKQSRGTKFRIQYQDEEIRAPAKQLKISKLSLVSQFCNSLKSNENETSKFKGFKLVEVFTGDIPQMEINRVLSINESNILVVGNNRSTSRIMIINVHNGCKVQDNCFRRPILHCDYSMDSRLLCICSATVEISELLVYRLSADFKTREHFSTLDLRKLHNVEAPAGLCLQPNSDYVWLLTKSGQGILKLHIKNGASTSCTEIEQAFPESFEFVSITASTAGDCVFLTQKDGKLFPFMTHSNHLLAPVDPGMTNCQIFGLPGHNENFLAAIGALKQVNVRAVTVHGCQAQLKLEEILRSDTWTTAIDENRNISKHWIHHLAEVFIKFSCSTNSEQSKVPIKLIALTEKKSRSFESALQKSLAEIQLRLEGKGKPLHLFKPEASTLSQENGCFIKILGGNGNEAKVPLGELLKNIIMLTPVQLARCESGQLLVLRNGRVIPTNDVEDVFEMESNISLGLLEAVLRNWLGPIIVVSTMGKQSTGKSFLLNHLFDTSFNISGTRCTDGCWMTINIIDNCLFVMLDFEGLGTFERSDEDDMLLTLFNSALSLMTLYKTEKRVDRETDNQFSKFNQGLDYITGDSNLFQGIFCIIINDVATHDSNGVKSEFISKIKSIVHRDKTSNFISKFYNDKFQIRPFSLFEKKEFFADIAQLYSYISKEIKPVFHNGTIFLNTVKILLAKLALGDFNSLSRQYVDGRIKFLRHHLENAFIFGQLEQNLEKLPEYFLRNLNDKNKEIESEWQPCELPNIGLLNDIEFNWSEHGGFDGVVSRFCCSVLLENTANYQSWREMLEKFMTETLNKRIERVRCWVMKNLDLWINKQNQDYDDAISAFLDVFKSHESNFRYKNEICMEKCSKCFLKCVLNKTHSSNHCCKTKHKCTSPCEFCPAANRFCHQIAGHDGRHYCRVGGHTCGKVCDYNSINGCEFFCDKTPDHEAEHKCANVHFCDKRCSHHNCTGYCKKECTTYHAIHKCEKDNCLEKCSVSSCNNICITKDHFHGFSELQKKHRREMEGEPGRRGADNHPASDHFCGNEHICPQECSQKGFCILSTERAEFDADFHGKRSVFKYKKRMTNVGKKLPCLVKIPPFEKQHEGGHWCTTDTESKVHTCRTRCLNCENICTKPIDHELNSPDVLHKTSHGNMIKCYWLSITETFELDNHEMEAGESAETRFCHIDCIKRGRGHTHIVDCPGNCGNKFSAKTDHRRHDSRKWLPDDGTEHDEIWHADYWKLMGFEDPCFDVNTGAFNKCAWFCTGPGHDEQNRSYCVLDLWHDPVTSLQEANLTRGYTSNGHAFSCTH